jgi:hypothetical protein
MSGAAGSQVLREYLVSLGFKIDRQGGAGLDTTLTNLDKKAVALGGSLTGVLAAAQAMVQSFAAQMESMYYSSRRIGTTVESLKSMETGASRVGLSAEQMRATLEGMARSLKFQPGLQELLENLGVKVQGRDMSDVAKDLFGTLKKFDPAVGVQISDMFNIPQDVFVQMMGQYDEFIAAEERQKKILGQVGIDWEKAAEAGRKYANMLREIQTASGTLMDALSVKLMPILQRWQEGLSQIIYNAAAGLTKHGVMGGLEKGAGVIVNELKTGMEARDKATGSVTAPQVSDALSKVRGGLVDKLFETLESKFGIKSGTMDKVWHRESGRGKHMLSPAGAQGHFQFMPPTAKEYGVQDPHDLAQSATGFAKYFTWLMRKYNGDEQKAFAAYNWGPGNLDKHGLDKAPRETLGYLEAMGVPYAGKSGGVTQTNNYHIHGGGDPQAAAAAVAREQELVNRDLLRNMKGNWQ